MSFHVRSSHVLVATPVSRALGRHVSDPGSPRPTGPEWRFHKSPEILQTRKSELKCQQDREKTPQDGRCFRIRRCPERVSRSRRESSGLRQEESGALSPL